jgi:hypothetical protein
MWIENFAIEHEEPAWFAPVRVQLDNIPQQLNNIQQQLNNIHQEQINIRRQLYQIDTKSSRVCLYPCLLALS